MLDSEAVFASRAAEIGLNNAEISTAATLSVNTLGRFAFAANYVPGQADEGPLMTLIGKVCAQDPPPEARVPLVRRLFYEAYTMANADMRRRLEKRDDDPPRKLAQAERASRYTDQVARLTGLDISGELEPSHALVDLVFQMIEENQLKYIRWEQCTKRDQELMGIKCDPTWKPDSQGVIREVKVQQEVRADTSSDLRLKYALQRRSLAIDQGRLCDYDKMEKWSCILLEAYSKAPIPGYQRVTIEQIQHADMEMFKYLIKNTRGGVRPTAGKAPIETALDTALTLPEIRLHLQPLPAGAKRKLDDEDSTSKPSNMDKKQKPPSQSSETERLRRHVENLQGQLRNVKGGKGRGKGKSKKGGQLHRPIRMPAELIGQRATTASGQPICFSYNMNGCRGGKDGERCSRGYHICSKCGENHSQRDCAVP